MLYIRTLDHVNITDLNNMAMATSKTTMHSLECFDENILYTGTPPTIVYQSNKPVRGFMISELPGHQNVMQYILLARNFCRFSTPFVAAVVFLFRRILLIYVGSEVGRKKSNINSFNKGFHFINNFVNFCCETGSCRF